MTQALQSLGHVEGMAYVCPEAAQVTVVHAQHVGVQACIIQFFGRMDFQQHFQPEAVGLFHQPGAILRGEARGNEQHGIRTGQAGLQQLVGVDDEVLAQQGEAGTCAGSAQVFQRAAEKRFVRQDGES